MIRKNIDVIAVAVLLTVIAVYSEARSLTLVNVVPNRGIVLASDLTDRFAFDPPSPPSAPSLCPLVFVK